MHGMAKSLVLAEKPSVARDIARILGCREVKKSSIEGGRYVVTWALGHLVELKMPEDYDHKYQVWKMDDLPIIPDHMETKPIRQTVAQFKAISRLFRRKDIDELIIATDAGREGELVARWIIEKAEWHKPIRRLWISSQTDRAVKDGFNRLKPAAAYDKLYESAVCRSEADWLIGLNVSRALTTKYNDSLSAGRVQTPTLAMIVERERIIRAFRPEPYWMLKIKAGGYTTGLRHGQNQRFHDARKAEEAAKKLRHRSAIVVNIDTKRKIERQPLPYDLTELQREANRRFGFSAHQTLNVLQRLYEHYKIVTYPRTDSRYLTRDLAATMPDRLAAVAPLFGRESRWIRSKRGGKVAASFVYNDAKVGDHHALLPTEQPVRPIALSEDEHRIYTLIVRRFLALFYPEHVYETRQADLQAGGMMLVIRDRFDVEPGFKALEEAGESQATPQPPLKKGQTLPIDDVQVVEKMTEPPARYSEADLLTQMEKYGLGTPATRADIIEKLIHSEAIERSGGRLSPTAKGRQLIALVNDELKSPELTAKWERELEDIAQGKGNPSRFMTQIRTQTHRLVKEVRESKETYKIQNLTGTRCPDCGSPMKEVRDRDGARWLVCINRDCGHRKRRDAKLSNRRCPHCHKRMEIHKGKAGIYFQCRTCGIVEKAQKAEKRADKRETQRIIGKLNRHGEAFGNSLADALKSALNKQNND